MSLGSFLLCDIRLFYYNDTRVAIEVILTIHKLFKNYFHILFVIYNGAENQLHVIAFVLCLTVLTISTIKNFYMCNICGVKQTQKAIERCCCCCMCQDNIRYIRLMPTYVYHEGKNQSYQINSLTNDITYSLLCINLQHTQVRLGDANCCNSIFKKHEKVICRHSYRLILRKSNIHM